MGRGRREPPGVGTLASSGTIPPMRKLLASPLPLAAVLLLALGLRVWGLTWGLPSATHYFSYHPDESVVLETSSVTMNVFAGRLLPHFYNYGSLQLYLVCFANTLAALFGGVDIVPKDFAVWYPQWAKMYLIGRCLTVGMGVGTVWAVYAIGLRLWGRRAGLLAALTLAIMPLHAQHSHFLTVDVPATFWGILSLLWAARLATGDARPLRAVILAGVFAGLAAATKYNLALALLPVIVAVWVVAGKRSTEEGRAGASPAPTQITVGVGLVPTLLAALTAFGLAFLAGCPGALLENKTFLDGLRYEAIHVQDVDDPTFRDTGSGFVFHIARNLDAGLGLPLLLLALVSVGYAAVSAGARRWAAGSVRPALLRFDQSGRRALRSLHDSRSYRFLALWVGRMVADGSRMRLFACYEWAAVTSWAALTPFFHICTRSCCIFSDVFSA